VLVLLTLLLVFSSGLWLRVIGDLGIGGFMTGVERGAPRGCPGDPLTRVITLWESNPASEHLFLWWRSPEDFAHRIAYPNHVHPYLFTMYGWIAGVRRLTGLPLWAATNTSMLLPVLALIAAFGTLLARSGLLRDRTSPRGVLTLFLATGILLTTWRVWIDLVRFNSDNPYPLLAAVLIVVYALLLPPMRTGAATIAAALFVALSPIHTPMLILAAVCLFGQGGRDGRDIWQRNRSLAVVCSVALLVGVVVYLEPQFLIARKGYATSGSSFLFRSGLDGDTTYFHGILQAVIAPCPLLCCYARPLSELLFPAVLPLAIFGPLAVRHSRSSALSLGRQLLFLTTPYLISLVFFPQSVSIHPYLYDHLLIIPIVVTGLTAMLSAPVEQRLTGGVFLVFLLFTGGILMANLIAIAQGLARALPSFAH
jgi:hypothetical protein